ncbi:hypothetical protein NDU88_001552 [Pleurodeles waltl]|uniref:Uncharacterized protein n=1 Tax=Pleurodeles waltl TaxID=8319 RepID=A0AAV7WN05_PLEWA|nr:hypothetical protein NDU88_001552 [Pleurodeles waltl]
MDVLATVRTESGTESRFSLLADALSGRHSNVDADSLAGNPDIRVPETVKTDNGATRGARGGGERRRQTRRSNERRTRGARRNPDHRRTPEPNRPGPDNNQRGTRRA